MVWDIQHDDGDRISWMDTTCRASDQVSASTESDPAVGSTLTKDMVSLIEDFRRNHQAERFGSLQVNGEFDG